MLEDPDRKDKYDNVVQISSDTNFIGDMEYYNLLTQSWFVILNENQAIIYL